MGFGVSYMLAPVFYLTYFNFHGILLKSDSSGHFFGVIMSHIRYFKHESEGKFLLMAVHSHQACQNTNAIQFNVSEYLSNYKSDEDTGFLNLSRRFVDELIPIMPEEFKSLVISRIEEAQEMANSNEIFQLSGNLKPLTLII